MRMFFGMILGCLLTVAIVYVHDSMAASRTGASEMIVNWDVAAREWGYIEETAHTAWLKLQSINARPTKNGEV